MTKLSRNLLSFAMLAGVPAATTLNPAVLHAQSSNGSVVGLITDATGAVIPEANVTIINTATNEKYAAKSNKTGEYRFVSLVPGMYTIDVDKSGFKRLQRQQIDVQVNVTVRADASLQAGSAGETIEVTAETPLLQTDSGTLGTVVEGKTIEETPLNGRNTLNLLALAPGVVPANNSAGAVALGVAGGHTSVTNWSAYSIGGGLVGQNAMYVDGAPINVLGGNGGGTIGFVPTQEAVQEFKVSSNASSSEFGRYSGGVVTMQTRGGANRWHGTAYEFLRNNFFNSNEFFTKASQLYSTTPSPNKPAKFNQNQYGVLLSGAIKHDKLFFMGSWEALNARTATLQTHSVPTPDMFAGIIDGRNIASVVNGFHPGCGATDNSAAGAGTAASTTIPKSCWDSSAAVMVTEWPNQNIPNVSGNFSKLTPTGSDLGTYIGRLDYVLSERQRLFARFVQADLHDLSQQWMPGGIMPSGSPWDIGGGTTVTRTSDGVLGDTVTINPTTIADVRFSVLRMYAAQDTPTHGLDLGIFGPNWAAQQKQMTFTNLPIMGFQNDTCPAGVAVCYPTAFGNAGQISFQRNDNVALVYSIVKVKGHHSLKFGGETRFMDRYVENESGNSLSAGGQYTFDGGYFTNSSWANFLLGMPNNAYQTNIREVASYNWYQGYYVNDIWQATRKLTINAGIRWELPGNIKEKKNNAIELAPNSNIPGTNIRGTAFLVASSQYPDRGSEPARHDLFAPNLGISFQATSKDVIRAGYGFSVAPIDIQSGLFPENFSINSFTNTFDYGSTKTYYQLSTPFPNGLGQPQTRAQFNPASYERGNLTAPVNTTKFPYTQQYNVSVSHQFPRDTVFEVAFAGSLATHIPLTYAYNELQPQYWNDRSIPQTVNPSIGATIPTTVSSGQLASCATAWTTTTTYGQCARPYNGYLTYTDAIGPYGSISYASMPTRIEKRFQGGGIVTGSYTWSKSLGNAGGGVGGGPGAGGSIQDWYNLHAERSVTASDVRHRATISYNTNLPFGKGGLIGQNIKNGFVSRLISGYSINGITSFQTGFPLGITASEPNGVMNIPTTFGAGTLRPNRVPGCNLKVGGSLLSHVLNNTPVFNTACFTASPATYSITTNNNGNSTTTQYATTLGNESRLDDALRAPAYANWDLSAQKTTLIKEGITLQLRMEYFNVFNRVRFGLPGTQLNGGGQVLFGQINGSSQNENQPRLGQISARLSF